MSERDTIPHMPDIPEELPLAQGEPTGQKPKRKRTILLFAGLGAAAVVVIVLLFVFVLPLLGGYDPLSADNPEVSHPDGLSVFFQTGEAIRLRIDSTPRQLFLDGQAERAFPGALGAIPAYLELKSPVYSLGSRGEGASVEVEIIIPNDSEPYHTLDLYTWDEEAGVWRFVPGHVDMGAGIIVTDELPSNIAVFQSQGVTPLIGTTLENGYELTGEAAAVMNLVMPIGFVAQPDGTVSGAPVGGWQIGSGYAVLPVVRADGTSISGLLNNPTGLALHVADLRALAIDNGYNGITIDYQGILETDRAVFAQFISDLGASLDEVNKVVVVVLPFPSSGAEGWNTVGYDWRAIGAAADMVIVSAGPNPADYAINGVSTSLLGWAVGEISRYKLHFASSSYSFDETNGALISYNDAVAALGSISFSPSLPAGEAAYQPGTDFSFDLSADVTEMAADQNSGAYVYTVNEDTGSRRVWILTASALRARLDLLSSFNLGGVVINQLGAPGNDGGMVQAITEFKVRNISSLPSLLQMRWILSDASGASLTENTGLATPWVWSANLPGSYTVQGVFVGSLDLDRGSVSLQIDAGDVEVVETEEPTPVVTAAPSTPAPTAAPTEAPTETPVVTAAPPPVAGTGWGEAFALGGQVPGYIAHPGEMRSAGMTWVKFQQKWYPGTDPGVVAGMIDAARANGFRVLLSISGPLYPESIDFANYVEFLRGVAAYQPDAIEVYNEMNLDREWPAGQIDPASYVNNMLAPGFNAIKSVSPGTRVIIGALAPTGFDNGTNAWSDLRYVQGLAAAGAANYADCIGAHHNSGTTSPSVRSGRPEGDHYSWYYLPTLEVYYFGMNQALPVCVTEFGYLTPEGIDQPLPDNFAWGAGNTLAEHAAWLGEGVQISRGLGYVPLVIVWNVDWTLGADADPQAHYAIIRPDGSCPACATLAAAMQ